ncbi:rhodanese-like domain-containing protein [Corynebacterium uterequi]|uniref:Rhodanese-related sulfurtransferase n=1 Tax=Corynebacterium uterequi TaxID=1072256 RepID=A0A0G3HIW8_9CORY|nr:rhodanese-like domain-containing protein [Corynebacterium uterequi]AKK11883.1 Rhodanese-related sulfurtransferase [Corynebacterium uterequi]
MKHVTVHDVPSDAVLIDVREPDEYAEAHAAGAINIPLSTLPERADEVPADGDVYLICKAGGRSAKAGEYLEQSAGRANLINVDGGTDGWLAAGLPTG